MKRKARRRRLQHAVEYGCVRLMLAVLGRVPWRGAGLLARWGGVVFSRCLPLRAGVLEENLTIAFGELSREEARRMRRAVFQQTLMLLFEMARLPRLTPSTLLEIVEAEPELKQRLSEADQSPRPTIVATGHLGNWELGAAWLAALFPRPVGVVYKPLHNPFLDRLLMKTRSAMGLRMFPTRGGSAREFSRHLRQGNPLGILSDQDARGKGIFVPFFGRPASTAPGLAGLVRRYDAHLIFLFCLRTTPGRFRIVHLEPHSFEGRSDEEYDDLVMSAYHEALESAIREAPEQYFWWHRRWKTSPPPEPVVP